MTAQQIADMDIRLQRFDFAYHVGWKTPDGQGHTVRVDTAHDALMIVDRLTRGQWLTQEGEKYVTR